MEKKYVKSPIKYVGSKYRLLDQIIPLFPKDIDVFVDLFAGSGTVGFNMASRTKTVKMYERDRGIASIIYQLIHTPHLMLQYMKVILDKFGFSNSYKYGIDTYKNIPNGFDNNYGYSRYNKEPFKKLVKEINKNIKEYWNMPISDIPAEYFYILNLYSFYGVIRYNNKGYINNTVGNRDFNKYIPERILDLELALHGSDISIEYTDFEDVKLSATDFIYADPPYTITSCAYNKYWYGYHEILLYNKLLKHHKDGGKFALSNMLSFRGKENKRFKKFIEDNNFTAHKINSDYSYSSMNKKYREKGIELLVTNY